MIRELSAAVLVCGLGFGVLGCQTDQNGNPKYHNDDTTSFPSSGNMDGSSGSGSASIGGSSLSNPNEGNSWDSTGSSGHAGSMSKEVPSTQP